MSRTRFTTATAVVRVIIGDYASLGYSAVLRAQVALNRHALSVHALEIVCTSVSTGAAVVSISQEVDAHLKRGAPTRGGSTALNALALEASLVRGADTATAATVL